MALWKNSPSEDTPINARNLSRSERYIEAVAGANGDFFVNIDGAGNLESGDIVRVSFPTATDGSENARLSIDGASGTFVDIKLLRGFDNIPAKLVENGDRILKYDGTRWILESNLVAYYEFASAGTSTGAIPVDINKDGSYEVIHNHGGLTAGDGNPSQLSIFYNGITTTNSYRYQRIYARSNLLSTNGGYGADAGFVYRFTSQNESLISLSAGLPVCTTSNSIVNNITTGSENIEALNYMQFLKEPQSNITSLTLTTTFNVGVGTTVKVYKK